MGDGADMCWEQAYMPDPDDYYEEDGTMLVEGVAAAFKINDTKVGKTYAVCVDDVWYGLYKTAPKFQEGDYIECEYTVNKGFNNLDLSTLKVTEGKGPAPVKKSAGAAASFAKADVKDASIRWQSARNAAIALAQVAADAGALDLGAKKDGKYEALQIIVNQQTVEYFEDTEKLRENGGSNPFEVE